MSNLKPHGLPNATVVIPFCVIITGLVAALGTVVAATPGLTQPSPAASGGEEINREQPPSRPVETAIVTTPSGDRLTVRSGPGASYGVIDSLANGQTLQLSGLTLGNWAQLFGGGWVYLPYLQMSEGAAGAN